MGARRSWIRRSGRVLVLVILGLGAAGLGSGDAAAAAAATTGAPPADKSITAPSSGSGPVVATHLTSLTDVVTYSIRTRYDGGGGCADERVRDALIGVPTAINMGGNALPDVVVELVVVPGVAGAPDTLELVVTKIAAGTLRGLVEVVVTPDVNDPARVAFGYDACEGGAPRTFEATITATEAQLSVDADTTSPGSSLTVIGSIFDAVGSTRVDPTSLAAGLAPVPSSVSAVVDIVGPGSYEATIETSRPTDLRLDYTDVEGASSTVATATVETFPGRLDLVFNASEVSYTASAPIDEVGFDVTTVAPGARTTSIGATLLDVPESAQLLRASPTRVTFTTPGTIGSATVDFASFEPAATLPTLLPLPGQYLVADVGPEHAVAEVRILDLSHADVDAGDPVVVDVTHAAGPFHVAATVAGATETRDLTVDVLDLPATARVTYSPTTQAFTYDGSAVIDVLLADVTSSAPLVDDADESHLRIEDVPTGLTGRLDSVAKTFTATLTGGALSLLEVQVTSGDDVRLPDGVQGVLVEDHDASYGAFVRVLGLQRASVGWGTSYLADVVHQAGPFELQVHADDPDAEALDVDGEILDLPAEARFEYVPGTTLTTVTYDGSAEIAVLRFDVVSEQPLFDDATEAHLLALGIPIGMDLTIDETVDRLDTAMVGGDLNLLEIELCSPGACAPPPPPVPPGDPVIQPIEPDGLWLSDLTASYRAFGRITGFERATAAWGDTMIVDVTHAAGPFDISVVQDKIEVRVIPAPEPPPPGPPCHPDHPDPDCDPCAGPNPPEDGCDEEPPGDTIIEIPYTITVNAHIADLPATARVEYSPESQTVSYDGSAVIDLITANYSTTGRAIVGRAQHAVLRLEDLPTGLDLVYDFGASGDSLAVDTAQPLGLLEFRFTNDLAAHVPSFTGDGFALHDIDDFDDVVEPVEDYYTMAGRVTRLVHLDYSDRLVHSDGDSTDDFDHQKAVHLDRAPSATGGLPVLTVDIRKPDESKFELYEFVHIDYLAPPPSMGVVLTNFERNTSTDNAYKWTEIEYTGSETGGGLVFQTNAGAGRSLLEATVTPVPAGSPGIAVCIAPDDAACSYLDQSGGYDEMSFSINVAEPVTVNFTDCKESGEHRQCHPDLTGAEPSYRNTLLSIQNLHIERSLVVMKEKVSVSWDIDNANIHLHTDGQPVHGEIENTRTILGVGGAGQDYGLFTQRTLHVVLPEGFLAVDRFGQIDCTPPGCSFSNANGVPTGDMSCPEGTTFEARVTPVYAPNFEDELCPAPEIYSVELADGSPATLLPGETTTLHVWGRNFSPSSCSGDWPPCSGPQVLIGALAPGGFLPDLAIDVVSVGWHDMGHLEVVVTLSPDAEPGPRAVRIENPVDDAGTAVKEDALEVLAG